MASRITEVAMADGDTVVVDAAFVREAFVWQIRNDASAVVTHRFSLAERPLASDWDEPPTQGTIGAGEREHSIETAPNKWLSWAVAGGSSQLRLLTTGDIFPQSADLTPLAAVADYNDFELEVGEARTLPLEAAFSYPVRHRHGLSYAVASGDNSKVTVGVDDNAVLIVTAVAVTIANTPVTITITARTPYGAIAVQTFDVTVVAAP